MEKGVLLSRAITVDYIRKYSPELEGGVSVLPMLVFGEAEELAFEDGVVVAMASGDPSQIRKHGKAQILSQEGEQASAIFSSYDGDGARALMLS